MEEIFSEILVGRTKRGDSVFCSSLVGGNLSRLVNFFWMTCKNNLFIVIWGQVQNIISLAMSLFFLIFLLFLSSIASSGFNPIFTLESVQKCEHKIKGKRFFVWNKESFLFLSYLFLEIGYMIVNWMCLFVYLKYKFASTYFIPLMSITTYNTNA